MKLIMSIMCSIAFISFLFGEPSRWETLIWVVIAFVNVHTDYN